MFHHPDTSWPQAEKIIRTSKFWMNSNGLQVSEEMRSILSRNPGFISSDSGGQRLAELYVDGSANFNVMQLSEFGLACFVGQLDAVQSMVESRSPPDLAGHETPYQHGYASLVVFGAQRIVEGPLSSGKWNDVLNYLLSKGMPPDASDIMGYTALDHATMHSISRKLDLARILLSSPHSGGPANPNHQNRRGMVSIFAPMMHDTVDAVDLLMEYGADLEIPDADGQKPSALYVSCGPKVTATVLKWIRMRKGEDALLDAKKCGNPQCLDVSKASADVGLKYCARCKTIRYCSVHCQRTHWPQHKVTCSPFSTSAQVTLKPHYHTEYVGLFSPSAVARNLQQIPTEPVPTAHSRASHVPKGFSKDSPKPKSLVIKVQVPLGNGALLVYTKKRDLVCMIRKEDNLTDYDKITAVVKSKGVKGLKAYFAAELRSKDELVVKVDNVLAEQPF